MADPEKVKVTELRGIGPATADDLADKGVKTEADLAAAYKRGDLSDVRQPVRERARRAAANQGGFVDPKTGVEVTPENRQAFEQFGTRPVSDFDSIDTRKARKNVDAVEGPGTQLAELTEEVKSGALGEQNAPEPLVNFAADVADNLGESELSSGQLQDVNRLTGLREAKTSLPSKTKNKEFRSEVDEIFTLGALETAQALAVHNKRGAKARRVDRRRSAPKTDDFEKWADDPQHNDFVGVDTKFGMSTFFADERKSKPGGFGSTTSPNRDKRTLKGGLQAVEKADSKAQERVIGTQIDSVTDTLNELDQSANSGRY